MDFSLNFSFGYFCHDFLVVVWHYKTIPQLSSIIHHTTIFAVCLMLWVRKKADICWFWTYFRVDIQTLCYICDFGANSRYQHSLAVHHVFHAQNRNVAWWAAHHALSSTSVGCNFLHLSIYAQLEYAIDVVDKREFDLANLSFLLYIRIGLLFGDWNPQHVVVCSLVHEHWTLSWRERRGRKKRE